MNNLQKLLSTIMQKLAPTWAADALDQKHNFLPKPIFDRWASGAAYRQMSGYPVEYYAKHYPLWFIPLLQKYWLIKGELICLVWGWWWVVESEIEKEYRERMEVIKQDNIFCEVCQENIGVTNSNLIGIEHDDNLIGYWICDECEQGAEHDALDWYESYMGGNENGRK